MISEYISRRSQKRILMLSVVLINKTMKVRCYHILKLIILLSFTFYCRTCLATEQKYFQNEANGYSVALAEGWIQLSMESPARAITPTIKFFGCLIWSITLFLPFAIRFLILRRPVLNLWSALPLAFVSGWLIVISGATFAELYQVAILNGLWVYLIVAASCYSYWAMHIGYRDYCIRRLTDEPVEQTGKTDQPKVEDRSEEVSGHGQACTGASISQVVEKKLDKIVHKKYQAASDVNIQGVPHMEGMEDEQVNRGRLTDEPAGQSGKQNQPKVKDRSVAVICAIVMATGIYLVLRDSQPKPTSKPDVEIMAKELSHALDGISKENITKELVEKLNDVPIKYTSLSDGFTVYFPSTPQQNTIENVTGGTVKNYQSVSQDGLVHYNVFFNYFDKKLLSDEFQKAYLNGHLTGRLLISKNSRVITNNQTIFCGFNASRYKYIDVVEGVEVLHEGVVFILDGDSVSLTCVYPKAVDPQPSLDEFAKSFELLPLDAKLSNEFWKDLSTGLLFRPPIDMHEREKKSRKGLIVTFVNKAGDSLSIFNVSADYPSFKLSDIRKEFSQATRDSEGFLVNTIHNSTLNKDFIQLVKLLEHENNIFMFQGYAPKQTFFRSERIFKESMNTVTFED